MNSPKRFAVIGRGIAGLMAAYHLKSAGYEPTVFGFKGDRASAAAQGILANKGLIFFDSPLFKAKLKSLASMQIFLDALEVESGYPIPRSFRGVSEPYWDREDFQKTISRIYRHKFWGAHQTVDREGWADGPETTRKPLGELFYPNDGWFDPLALLNALEGYLRDRGTVFMENHVSAFRAHSDDSVSIQTKERDAPYTFDRIILASGAGTGLLWEAAGLKAEKMFFIGGQTLALPRQAAEQEPKIIVKGTRSLALLKEQVILGSSSWKGFESDDVKADAEAILSEAQVHFGLKFTGPYESRTGVRFRFKDRMPLVGWVSTGPLAQKLYLMTGFYKNGMHLAETCAKEMLLDVAEKGDERLYPEFSPRRFSV
ncbi:MAG: FAD-binding oxidoreductase [Chitinophagaceae bacterium]|nr:FAD-binding oxidoreductase [Oligoflexus sp.]